MLKLIDYQKYKNRLVEKVNISNNLHYHLLNSISLNENVFMIESDAWCELWVEARELYNNGLLKPINNDELTILERLKTGVKAKYQGKDVILDSPKNVTGQNKRSIVYRDSGRKDKDGNIIANVIRFGSTELSIKNDDPVASKSFRARHKCNLKKDPNKAGWWSCNVHLFHKQLGLKSDKPW